MNILDLRSYPINEIFSFLEYKRILQICKRSNSLSKILYIKKSSYKLYYFLNNAFKKYNVIPLNLQNIYNKTFDYFENELGTEEINLIFSNFLEGLGNKFKNEIVKLSPLFDYYYEFLGIRNQQFELKLVSLYNIEKNDFLKNEKITSLDINFTISSSMEKDISTLNENLNYLLSLNKYKSISIVIIGEGIFKQNSFEHINLENLEQLKLSFMELSSQDIIDFFTKVFDSHKKYPLKYLDLSSNKLDDECSDLICWVIEINFPELKKINIHGNNFTSDGAERILEKLYKSKEIDLALNKVGKEETDIFNKFKDGEGLKILTDFKFDIRKDFNDNLVNFYGKFKDLNKIGLFENNEIINVNQVYKLEEFLGKEENDIIEKQINNISSCLNKMKLIDNINFTGTYKSGQILEKCENAFLQQIKEYSFSFSKLSNKSIEVMEKMKKLENIIFINSPLNNDLISILYTSIKKKTFNLKEISFTHNFLTSKSVDILIKIIQNTKNLTSFIIAENEIGKDNIIKIVKSLSENCHDLNILDISKTMNKHNECVNELWDYLSKIYNLNKLKIQDNYINGNDLELFMKKFPDYFIMLNLVDFSYNEEIDNNLLNQFLPELKKYLNFIEVIIFWGVGKLSEDELNKFRNIFPGRIKLRNKRRR